MGPRRLGRTHELVLGDRYTLAVAPTGAATLAAIDREGPDVVLLDIDLPDLDGVSVLRRIAARDCEAFLRPNPARLSPARAVGAPSRPGRRPGWLGPRGRCRHPHRAGDQRPSGGPARAPSLRKCLMMSQGSRAMIQRAKLPKCSSPDMTPK